MAELPSGPKRSSLEDFNKDKTIRLWSAKKLIWSNHKNFKVTLDEDYAALVRWTPDSNTFVVAKFLANVVEIYEMETKSNGWITNVAKVLTFPKYHEHKIVGLGLTSNGNYVVTCSEKTDLVVTDINGELLSRTDTHLMSTYYACLSPCGRFISACGFVPEVRIWEVVLSAEGEFIKLVRFCDLKGHISSIHQVAFSGDSSKMATISNDGLWKFYDIKGKRRDDDSEEETYPKLITTREYTSGQTPSCIALSPRGDVVAVSSGNALYLYFADTGKLDATIKNIFPEDYITRILFDSQGKYVLVSSTKQIRIFHNITGYRARLKTAKKKIMRMEGDTSENLNEIAETKYFLSLFAKPSRFL